VRRYWLLAQHALARLIAQHDTCMLPSCAFRVLIAPTVSTAR
jgi:hypothetical protein